MALHGSVFHLPSGPKKYYEQLAKAELQLMAQK